LSVLFLVLLLVSFITVMFYVNYLISLTHVFHCVFVTVGLYRVDWCIDLFSCTAARVLNKLTYLLKTFNVREAMYQQLW